MEVISVESITITSYNIDNIEIARTNDLEIEATVNEAFNFLQIYKPQNISKVYFLKQKE